MKRDRDTQTERVGASQRMLALRLRKQAVEASIESEANRPAPCSITLQRLKRNRLWLKDQLARLKRAHRTKGLAAT